MCICVCVCVCVRHQLARRSSATRTLTCSDSPASPGVCVCRRRCASPTANAQFLYASEPRKDRTIKQVRGVRSLLSSLLLRRPIGVRRAAGGGASQTKTGSSCVGGRVARRRRRVMRLHVGSAARSSLRRRNATNWCVGARGGASCFVCDCFRAAQRLTMSDGSLLELEADKGRTHCRSRVAATRRAPTDAPRRDCRGLVCRSGTPPVCVCVRASDGVTRARCAERDDRACAGSRRRAASVYRSTTRDATRAPVGDAVRVV